MDDENKVPDDIDQYIATFTEDERRQLKIAEAALDDVDRLRAENAALRAEVQEGAEALLRTHRILSAKQAENAALREIVQVVAACEARESEGWHQVGLFHDTVNVLWIRAKARALLGPADAK